MSLLKLKTLLEGDKRQLFIVFEVHRGLTGQRGLSSLTILPRVGPSAGMTTGATLPGPSRAS